MIHWYSTHFLQWYNWLWHRYGIFQRTNSKHSCIGTGWFRAIWVYIMAVDTLTPCIARPPTVTALAGVSLEKFGTTRFLTVLVQRTVTYQVGETDIIVSDFSNSSEIWQASRQQRCQVACQISERCDHDNIQSRGFGTSRDLAVRRLTAYWIEVQITVRFLILESSIRESWQVSCHLHAHVQCTFHEYAL